jgi:hypothetical protein
LQAFQALVGGHKLSNADELELVRSLDIPPSQVTAGKQHATGMNLLGGLLVGGLLRLG